MKIRKQRPDGKFDEHWKTANHVAALALVDGALADLHRLERDLSALLPKALRGRLGEELAAARARVSSFVLKNDDVWTALDKGEPVEKYDERLVKAARKNNDDGPDEEEE